jgi:hypothetical protein
MRIVSFEGGFGLALTFIGPSAAEITVQAAAFFIFQVAVVGSSFCASARGYRDAQNECCEDGFESGFHGDVV